ncbi:xanthine dehydrogenase family protein molybdopterin-binding subunit [Pseudoruegeria sp. HB172150]|uniref:xanthine dehydrogenase family protein molybdopterin-binding subunit n=1 Tax=Pseudoruegeria sp. HB172150 TaxID=2721164 RepID=UPI001556003C|nr:molybdopterin cofactor-binding domain-containing protein [Pseudoruegeria sp. HB172150]
MSRAGKIARRTFLIGSAAIAGGVAFGVYMVSRDPENPLSRDLGSDEVTFNPWVRITPEKITLITPHADIGQGVVHAQAALIAEEMDLDLGQFETSFGPPSPAYWNTAMAVEGAPFRSDDDGLVAEATRSFLGGVFKILGFQGTGGSSSIPDSYVKLREAGATARETLKAAASAEHGIPAADLTTKSGHVILPDGTAIPYTALADRAATIEPVTGVPLRDPSQWRLIGQSMPRIDMVAKSTGTQTFGIDLTIDGMVYAAPRVNPNRGPLNGYDDIEARAMRGVKDIVPVTNGIAVIADNTWRAQQAADAVTVDWGTGPYPPEQEDHWKEVAASFTEDRLDREWRNDGDVEATAAAQPIMAEYRAGYAAHQPLEPINAIIRVTDDAVEVWSAHQFPRFVQQIVGGVTGHDAEQVIFYNQFGGGSFGHRLEFENLKLAAEIANQMRGTPVKLTFSREEDFAHDFPRQIGMARGKGTVLNGRIESMDIQIATTSAARSQFSRLGLSMPGPDGQIVSGVWNAPYMLPNYRVRAYAVPELAPVSSWRSVGAVTAAFFGESFLDELIHAAGADPLEERLRLADTPRAAAVLEAVGEMSGWGRDPGENRGLGVALVESFGTMTAEAIEVENTERGIRILNVWAAAEVGTVIDPVNFENHVQGGVVWGLGHAMNCEITYSGGVAQQTNFHAHEGMRLYQCPNIEVRGIELSDRVHGIGEPPVPPAAPALANAIYAATGQRIREMPMHHHIDFA